MRPRRLRLARSWSSLDGNRSVRWVIISQGISLTGSRATAFALPVIAVERLHAGPLAASIIVGVTFGAEVAVAPIVGNLADRLRPATLMVASELFASAVAVVLAALCLANEETTNHLVVGAALIGGGTAAFDTAMQAFIPAVCTDGRGRAAANSLLEMARSIAAVLGPPAAGALIATVGAGAVLLADAGTYWASVAILVTSLGLARSTSSPTVSRSHTQRIGIFSGVRHIWSCPDLVTAVTGSALLSLGGAMIGGVAVVFVLRDVGMSPVAFGIAGALGAVGAVLGATRAPGYIARRGDRHTAALMGAGMAVSLWLLPLLAALPHFALLVTYEVSFGFAAASFSVAVATLRQRLTGNVLQGRVFGAFKAANSGAILFGFFAGGLLARYVFSLLTTILVGASISVIGALRLWLPAPPISRSGSSITTAPIRREHS